MDFPGSDGWYHRDQSTMPFQVWKPPFVTSPDTMVEIANRVYPEPKVGKYSDFYWGYERGNDEGNIMFARLWKGSKAPSPQESKKPACGYPGSKWVRFEQATNGRQVSINHKLITAFFPHHNGDATVIEMANNVSHVVMEPYIVVRRVLLQVENVREDEELQTP